MEKDKIKLKIEYVPIDTLMPDNRNARKHGEEDVAAIAASIRQFGFADPIGIWQGQIVEGHGRLLAAKELGLDKVPVIRLDHLTDKERRAYALAHNRTAELSGWDKAMLAEELEAVSAIDMAALGFDLPAADGSDLPEFDIDGGETTGSEGKPIICPHCGFEWTK